MKANRLLLACALVTLTCACASERRTASRPAPTPAPRPSPIVAPAPVPGWRDAPLTPGQWSYAAAGGGSATRYGVAPGEALLTMLCDRSQGGVILLRAGQAPAPVPLTVTTSEGTRSFSAAPQNAGPPALAVRFAPGDPFLDQMAFSRGRFAVEAPGLPPLYLPSWPEVSRVVEDCR